MVLGSISQLFKDAEEKLKMITTPQSISMLPDPIVQPAEKSDIFQLFKSAEDKVYQKEIGSDTLSSSKFEL